MPVFYVQSDIMEMKKLQQYKWRHLKCYTLRTRYTPYWVVWLETNLHILPLLYLEQRPMCVEEIVQRV